MKTEPTKRQRIAAWMQAENERAIAARVTARLKPQPQPRIVSAADFEMIQFQHKLWMEKRKAELMATMRIDFTPITA